MILHQNAIGWRQIFNGRFAIAWASVQDDFLARREPNASADTPRLAQKTKGKQWQKKFIVAIWMQWTVLWTARNAMVRGTNLVAQRQAHRRTTEAELRSVYDTREQLEPEFQRLLFRDVQCHIQRQPHYITRNWLQMNVPIFRESLRRSERRAIKGVQSIRSYFAPVW